MRAKKGFLDRKKFYELEDSRRASYNLRIYGISTTYFINEIPYVPNPLLGRPSSDLFLPRSKFSSDRH